MSGANGNNFGLCRFAPRSEGLVAALFAAPRTDEFVGDRAKSLCQLGRGTIGGRAAALADDGAHRVDALVDEG